MHFIKKLSLDVVAFLDQGHLGISASKELVRKKLTVLFNSQRVLNEISKHVKYASVDN